MITHSLAPQSVIGSLIRLEEGLGRLYGVYAGRFPDMAEFWRHLALEKQLHAARMKETDVLIQSRNLDIGAERISLDILHISRERIESAHVVASRETEPLTELTALNTARELEEQTIGTLPFAVFPDQDTPADIREVFDDLHKLQILHSAAIGKKLDELQRSSPKSRIRRLFSRK